MRGQILIYPLMDILSYSSQKNTNRSGNHNEYSSKPYYKGSCNCEVSFHLLVLYIDFCFILYLSNKTWITSKKIQFLKKIKKCILWEFIEPDVTQILLNSVIHTEPKGFNYGKECLAVYTM